VIKRGWRARFDEPILLPDGKTLTTLRDAATYITKLSKAEHDAAEWQAAMQALLLVAEHGGPTMLARIGVMLALNRRVERDIEMSALQSFPAIRLFKLQSETQNFVSVVACR
jgi:hypothetical protein